MNVFPCILINLMRPQTQSSLWDVCPPEFVDDFLRNNNPENCAIHFDEKYPGWQLCRWIAVGSPQEAVDVIENGHWPE